MSGPSFSSGYPTVWVAISRLTLAPSGCPQVIQAMSLPSACNRCFPVQTCSPVEDLSIWVLLSWELWLGVYSVFVCFFSLLVMLSSEIQKIPRNPLVRGFPDVGNFSSFTTPFPGWVSIPNSFVSLFVFYILSCLLLKKMGCLSGCLVSCTRVQKLLCGNCSEFK